MYTRPDYSVKLEFGDLVDGVFEPSEGEGCVLGPESVQSVTVSRGVGDEGRPAPGVCEAAQCEASILTTALPDGWRDRWLRVTVRQDNRSSEGVASVSGTELSVVSGAGTVSGTELAMEDDCARYDASDESATLAREVSTKLGAFRPDRSTVRDDRLFTSFTAYDCLYWIGSTKVMATKKEAGDFTVALTDMWANLATSMLSEHGLQLTTPDADLTKAYSYTFFRPYGTARDVLAALCLLTGLCATTDGDGRIVTVSRTLRAQDVVERGDYAAGSLTVDGDWDSEMLGVVIDVNTTYSVDQNVGGTVYNVSMELDVVSLAGDLTTSSDGGYLVTPDASTMVGNHQFTYEYLAQDGARERSSRS